MSGKANINIIKILADEETETCRKEVNLSRVFELEVEPDNGLTHSYLP